MASPTLAPTAQPPPAAAPVRERRLTVGEYFAMGRAGILGPDERTELVAGKIVERMAEGPLHSLLTDLIAELFRSLLRRSGPDEARVLEDHPLVLPDEDALQPDVFLIRQETRPHRHPGPADVLLVVEVAVTTLPFDRDVKLPRYAAAAVPEVWIVNTEEGVLEVYRDPHKGRYRQARTVEPGGEVAVEALPGLPPISGRDLLGGSAVEG